MVKRSLDQKLRLRKFDARHEKIETGAVVKSHRRFSGVKEEEVFVTSGKKNSSVRRETNAVSSMRVTIVQDRHQKPRHPLSHQHRGVEVRREKRSLRGRNQSEKFNRPPVKYFLKGTCTKSPCEYWHPPECQFYEAKSGCEFGAECSFPHWKVEEPSNKKPKEGDDRSAVGIAKSVRQLSCVSQDAEPPESAAISKKGPKVLGPIRRVRLTRAALRQANIRESKGPSLGKIQVKKKSSTKLLRYENWGQISRRDCKTRAMRPRRCGRTCQENL